MAQSPVRVLLNSGKTPQEKAKLAESIEAAFAEAGRKASIITVAKGSDLRRIADEAAKKSASEGVLLAAAGGDGTINLAAGLCCRHGVTLGVIPLGTFNYFARQLEIPVEIPGAVQVIVTGAARKAAVGMVEGRSGEPRIFLNNASFGLYTKLIRQREQASSRFGRLRPVAALAAARSLFERHQLLSVSMDAHGEKQAHRTPMVFVGNNTLQLENLGMIGADCTRADRLAVIVMEESSRWEIARFLLRGAAGYLKDEDKLREFCADAFETSISRPSIEVAIDGEIVRFEGPLRFRVDKESLSVVAPVPEAA